MCFELHPDTLDLSTVVVRAFQTPTHYGTMQNILHICTVMSTTSLPNTHPWKGGLVTVQHDFKGRDHNDRSQ